MSANVADGDGAREHALRIARFAGGEGDVLPALRTPTARRSSPRRIPTSRDVVSAGGQSVDLAASEWPATTSASPITSSAPTLSDVAEFSHGRALPRPAHVDGRDHHDHERRRDLRAHRSERNELAEVCRKRHGERRRPNRWR